MTIDVDKTKAIKTLEESYQRCSTHPVTSCPMKSTIDFIMEGKGCLTYRYIMFTAFLAKITSPDIDILSLQANDDSDGAYDARSLASKVVFKFQKERLGNILDGANPDPLVNNPGRYPRLSLDNHAQAGDPTKALNLLCEDLPKITKKNDAQQCLDYIVTQLIERHNIRIKEEAKIVEIVKNLDIFSLRQFMNDLLDMGFNGASLVIVATALYHLQFPDDEVIPHPTNQSGSSKRQFSDLDLKRDNHPFMGTELKDKPFKASDVEHAAQTAYDAGASSLIFVAGRQAASSVSEPPTYYSKTKEKYAGKGMYVGITSIDSLMDTILASHTDADISDLFEVMRHTSEKIGSIDAQMWIYEHIQDYASKDS